ncbi:MAG: hypothetical protein ACE5E0_03370 [Terriglobia bacterium]
MIKTKTFTQTLEIFKTMRELEQLDDQVNSFIAEKSISRVVSVSDSVTADDSGATIGIIRVLTYEE